MEKDEYEYASCEKLGNCKFSGSGSPNPLNNFLDWVRERYQKQSKAFAEMKDVNHFDFLFFRGQPNSEYKLTPSLFRKMNDKVVYKYKDNERLMILDYLEVAPAHTFDYSLLEDVERVLVEMQHNEIPTRLLDWTYAPLTALFFACQEDENVDGAVFCMDAWGAYHQWKKSLEEQRCIKVPTIYLEIGIQARCLVAMGWRDDEIREWIYKKYNYMITPEEYKIPLPFYPQYRNRRVFAQHGVFTIWGKADQYNLEGFSKYKGYIHKLVIDKQFKREILKDLEMLFINDYNQYPDLLGVSRLMKKNGGLFFLSRCEFENREATDQDKGNTASGDSPSETV